MLTMLNSWQNRLLFIIAFVIHTTDNSGEVLYHKLWWWQKNVFHVGIERLAFCLTGTVWLLNTTMFLASLASHKPWLVLMVKRQPYSPLDCVNLDRYLPSLIGKHRALLSLQVYIYQVSFFRICQGDNELMVMWEKFFANVL